MPRFLFWNLAKRNLCGFVGNLVRQEDVDVLILAECRIPLAAMLEELNAERPDYQYAWGVCGHLVFFTRFDSKFLNPLSESPRVSIRRLTLPARQSLLIAAAHLPSKMGYSKTARYRSRYTCRG